ncbi:MAG: hypothetical protein HW390_450 [Candidatus Brocadiaceae bacterium]|nr:hypothetical protein [Candidatus Brocadiaceae bacterium]
MREAGLAGISPKGESSQNCMHGLMREDRRKLPVLEIYQRYFDIQDDKDFFNHALGFPLLAYRGDQIIASEPVAVGPSGSLVFISDIREGEEFRIGFADPKFLRESSVAAQRKMLAFEPEAILLFTCGCRRWVLRDDAEAETKPFEAIAPTAGFYTIGEFCNQKDRIPMLSLAFVAVSMREEPRKSESGLSDNPVDVHRVSTDDVYSSSHTSVIARLLHFINVMRVELEQANHELLLRSTTDKLTHIFNRLKLDESLNIELSLHLRPVKRFSV